MKKLGPLVLSLVFILPLYGQEKTLVGKDFDHGGFGAPVIKLTEINGGGKVMTGARGGWIINHTFVLGGGSYNLVNEAKSDGTPFDVDYSGLEMEYIGRPMDLIHYSVYLLIGGGDIRERKDDNPLNSVLDADGIFVIAPEANLLVNVTERFLWEPGWDIAGSMAWKSWD